MTPTALLLTILFCLPKINLISVGNFNAGIRADDALIAIFAMFYLFNKAQEKVVRISKVERSFFWLAIALSFSSLINAFGYGRGSLLFPARMVEYFLFFYLGWRALKSETQLRRVVMTTFWLQSVVGIMQLGGIMGGWTVYGYRFDVSERIIGLTGGPWELGIVLNFCSAYVLIMERKPVLKYLVFGLAFALILANGSRMSLLAQLAVLVGSMLISGQLIAALKRLAVIVVIAVVGALAFEGSSVAERSEGLSGEGNVRLFQQAIRSVEATEDAPNWGDLGVLSYGSGVDMSWSMRGNKWVYAAKMWLLNPGNTLWGVGMGTFGNALDGGWLRLLSETGVIGLVLFLLMLRRIQELHPVAWLIVVALAVNMLFIDIHMAYKAMSMLFAFAGGYLRQLQRYDELPRMSDVSTCGTDLRI